MGETRMRDFLGIAALATGPLCVGAMLTVVIPILPNIAQDISQGSVGKFTTQLLVAMPMLGLVIGGLLATVIFARFQARTVMIGALALFALVGAFGAIAHTELLIASRLAMGAISACIGAASTALIGERVSPENRPRVLGPQMAASSMFGICAMLLSGFVSDRFGWRSSFLIFPAMAVLIIALVLIFTSPSEKDVAASQSAVERRRIDAWGPLLALWPLFLFVLAINATAFTTNSQASFVLAGEGVTTSSGRAQVMSLNQIMLVMAAISFPFVRSLIGMRFMPALILLVMGTGLILLGRSDGLTGAAIALAVLGMGNGWLFPYQGTLLLQRAAPNVRGQAAGVMVSAQFGADALNPLLLAPLIQIIGLKETIALVGGIAAVGAAAAFLQGLRSENDNSVPAAPLHH